MARLLGTRHLLHKGSHIHRACATDLARFHDGLLRDTVGRQRVRNGTWTERGRSS